MSNSRKIIIQYYICQFYFVAVFLAAAAWAAFLARINSANSLYRLIQSFLLLSGTQLAILSHRSAPTEAGYVFNACSNNFCSSFVHGAEKYLGKKKLFTQLFKKYYKICN